MSNAGGEDEGSVSKGQSHYFAKILIKVLKIYKKLFACIAFYSFCSIYYNNNYTFKRGSLGKNSNLTADKVGLDE